MNEHGRPLLFRKDRRYPPTSLKGEGGERMVRESAIAIVPRKGLITLEGRAEGKSPLEGIHWGSKLRVNKPMGRTEEGSEVIQKGT